MIETLKNIINFKKKNHVNFQGRVYFSMLTSYLRFYKDIDFSLATNYASFKVSFRM